MFDIFTKDSLRASVEEASGGQNTILYDDYGIPNVMIPIPKFKIQDVLGTTVTNYTDTFPAFTKNGEEADYIFISPYAASKIVGGDLLHSPISGTSFIERLTPTQARTYASNKGSGWHLLNIWEKAALSWYALINMIPPPPSYIYRKMNDFNKLMEYSDGRITTNSKTGLLYNIHITSGVNPLNLLDRILVGQTSGCRFIVRNFKYHSLISDYSMPPDHASDSVSIFFIELLDTTPPSIVENFKIDNEGSVVANTTSYSSDRYEPFSAPEKLGYKSFHNLNYFGFPQDFKFPIFIDGIYLDVSSTGHGKIMMINENDYDLDYTSYSTDGSYIVKDPDPIYPGSIEPCLGTSSDLGSYEFPYVITSSQYPAARTLETFTHTPNWAALSQSIRDKYKKSFLVSNTYYNRELGESNVDNVSTIYVSNIKYNSWDGDDTWHTNITKFHMYTNGTIRSFQFGGNIEYQDQRRYHLAYSPI